MEITKTTLTAFRVDFADAVKELENKYGVAIQMKKIGYSSDDFSAKIEVKNKDSQGEIIDSTFATYASLFGLDPSWQGKSFIGGTGKTLKVIGLNTRRSKNPVELQGADGKTYKCSADYLKRFMAGV